MRKMNGGVLQDPNDPRNNFFNFLKNSSISLLSNSSNYGTILKVQINNPSYESPYSMFRSKHFGEKVKTLVVKICPLVKQYKKNQSLLLIGGKEKKTTIMDDFLKEYYTQIFIAIDTCKYLESVCPFPVYIDFFKKSYSYNDDMFKDIPTIPDTNLNEYGSPTDYMFNDNECLDLFKSKFDDVEINNQDDEEDFGNISENDDFFGGGPNNIFQQLINNLDVKYDYLGIIAMEIAEGYSTLRTFRTNPANYKLYQNFARYEIITLALEQRLLHCDFHDENILINPDYEGYFNGQLGKSFLIDFGLMKYIPDNKYNEIRNLIAQTNYDLAIHKIYELSIPEALWEYPGYKWFKQHTKDDIREILTLIQKRQQSKQDLERFSRESRTQNPSTSYPIIPLNLRNYQKYLPKMSYGLYVGGNSNDFYKPAKSLTIDSLLENIFKTISIGINSFFNINKKLQETHLIQKDVPNMIDTKSKLNEKIAVGGKKKRKTKRHVNNRKKKTRKYNNKNNLKI